MPKSTPLEKYPQLKTKFERLREITRSHIDIGHRMLQAANAKIYPPDLVLLAVLKRSIDLLDGMGVLIDRWNFIASAPLLRLQLDNLLKLSYFARADSTNATAHALLSGKPLYKFRDSSGKPLTDARLRQYARRQFPWLDKVYEETSRMIHLSDKHFAMTTTKIVSDEEHIVEFGLGVGTPHWPVT